MLPEWRQESLLHGPGGFAPEGREKQAEHGCVGNGSRSGFQDGGPHWGQSSGYASRRKRQELSKNLRRQGGPGIKTRSPGR